MMKDEMEYAIINNAVSILAIICNEDNREIIDSLTGCLWNEEEAECIKENKRGKAVLEDIDYD